MARLNGKPTGKTAAVVAMGLAALALLMSRGSGIFERGSVDSANPKTKLPPALIRVSKAGYQVDGMPAQLDGCVAAAKRQGSAELIVTGDARHGDHLALVDALKKNGIPYSERLPPSTSTTPSGPTTTTSTPATVPTGTTGGGGSGGAGGDAPPKDVPVTRSAKPGQWWRPQNPYPPVLARPFDGRADIEALASSEPKDSKAIQPARDNQVIRWIETGEIDPIQWVFVQVTPRLLVRVTRDRFTHKGVRLCCSVVAAQHLADACGGLLFTAGISDAVWRAAAVKLAPQTEDPNAGGAVAEWLYSEDRIAAELDRATSQAFKAGVSLSTIKNTPVATTCKDYCLTARLLLPGVNPDTKVPYRTSCPIYGWHHLDGSPIQSVNGLDVSLPHFLEHTDYSQGPRAVHRQCFLDGAVADLATVYQQHPELVVKGGLAAPPIRHPAVPLRYTSTILVDA